MLRGGRVALSVILGGCIAILSACDDCNINADMVCERIAIRERIKGGGMAVVGKSGVKRLLFGSIIGVAWVLSLWVAYWAGFSRSFFIMHVEWVAGVHTNAMVAQSLERSMVKGDTGRVKAYLDLNIAMSRNLNNGDLTMPSLWSKEMMSELIWPEYFLQLIRDSQGREAQTKAWGEKVAADGGGSS